MVAIRIIWFFWKQPVKGMKKKKHLERNIMGNEVFTEAVPTSLIMSFLMALVVLNQKWTVDNGIEAYEPYESRELLVENGHTLFFFTFATSALSAGLGLAKCLKVRSVVGHGLVVLVM